MQLEVITKLLVAMLALAVAQAAPLPSDYKAVATDSAKVEARTPDVVKGRPCKPKGPYIESRDRGGNSPDCIDPNWVFW